MTHFQFIDYLLIGNTSTEFIVDLKGIAHNDFLGGSLLYTAGSLRCWKDRIGLFGDVQAENMLPLRSLLEKHDFDVSGIRINEKIKDDRNFFGYVSPDDYESENPVAFYASKGLTFPKNLIGYTKINQDPQKNQPMDDNHYYLEDFPPPYLETSAIHLCPADLKTHIQLSSLLHHDSHKTLSIQSSSLYMKSSSWEYMPVLMKDLTAFITTSAQLSALFKNRSQNIWEMTEYLCSLGCDYLVVDDGHYGQLLFDSVLKKRYQIPAYPTSLIDPTGMRESFCGGFIAGVKKNYDPLEAVLHGNISASFTGEGSGPFYVTNSYKNLIENRLKQIQELVITL